MPTTPHDVQQTGIIAAIGAAIGAASVALIKLIGEMRQEAIKRKTTLEVRAQDGAETYTKNIQRDLEVLTARFMEASAKMDEMSDSIISLKERVSHQKIEMEKMQYQIDQLKGEKARMEQQHAEHVEMLMAQITEKQARIDILERHIADAEIIGVGEKAPIPRMRTE